MLQGMWSKGMKLRRLRFPAQDMGLVDNNRVGGSWRMRG